MDAHVLQRAQMGGLGKIGVRARFIALAVCAACATPDGATLRASVSQERRLELQLRNNSQRTLGYNLCASNLERRSGQAWQPVASQRICTMELRTLAPGGEARYALALEELPPGEYRATTRVEGLPLAVITEPFQLR